MTVRIGTRASKLALTQTQQTADQLAAVGGFPVELVHIRTDGDVLTGSLSQMGGTGVFVAALRDALLRDECDVAVHSLKDLPTGAAVGLSTRRDAQARGRPGRPVRPRRTEAGRPAARRHGGHRLAAPRRPAPRRPPGPGHPGHPRQRGHPPGPRPRPARATPPTHVVAGKSCDLDAVVLAAAGLERIGRLDAVSEFLETDVMLPAAGQGSLAIECRTADAPRRAGSTDGSQGVLAQALAALDDPDTRLAVTAERALLARLEAGCAAPVGAYAYRKGSMLYLEAVVCAVDGTASVRDKTGHGRADRGGGHPAGHRTGRGPAGRRRRRHRGPRRPPDARWTHAGAADMTGQASPSTGGRPLEDLRVLITRSPDRARPWSRRSSDAGAEPLLLPLIDFERAADQQRWTSPATPWPPAPSTGWWSAASPQSMCSMAKAAERGMALGYLVCPAHAGGRRRAGHPAGSWNPRAWPWHWHRRTDQSAAGLLDVWPGRAGRVLLPQADIAAPRLADGLAADRELP